MDNPIRLFKTSEGQAQYIRAYDAALGLWPVRPEERNVTTPFGKTHVLECGSPTAPPLVLLHAGQASSTMWFPNIAGLCDEFHVLALDTIGEPGKSTPVRQYATKQDSAAWLEGVLDALNLSKTHVMGLSRGGWLALNLAMHCPERLDRIVLLSPAAAFVALNSFFMGVAQAVMRIPKRSVAKMALNSWVAKGFVVNELFAEQFMLGLLNWNWKVNTSGYSGTMPSTFTDQELGQVQHPVLMLIGDQDRLNPPKALERAKRTIKNCAGEIIPKAGHFLNMEQPEIIDWRVMQFFLGNAASH